MPDLTNKRLETLLNMDVSTMDQDELTELNIELSRRRDEVREKQREVTRTLDGVLVEREARLALEAMSLEQRAALARIVQVEGIPSEESVGG